LGVTKFGQSGDVPDLFRSYRIDAEAILAAAFEATRRPAV
jgi:pyruvate dehydrogenase complex dehydrogenase (E1) component